jgi:diadenosine tetraphosphate (Ap4A) HIT family hydrolase
VLVEIIPPGIIEVMVRNAAVVAGFAFAFTLLADTPCACDVTRPETLDARQCSLCREAEKQPAGVPVFFLKDANPRKPNRVLALPRAHAAGLHRLADYSPQDQAALWTAAINRARELYPEGNWAIAFNGDHVRTQCHTHLHIGRILPGVEAGDFLVIDSATAIPPPDDTGYWIHPIDTSGHLHLHRGEQITETVILR